MRILAKRTPTGMLQLREKHKYTSASPFTFSCYDSISYRVMCGVLLHRSGTWSRGKYACFILSCNINVIIIHVILNAEVIIYRLTKSDQPLGTPNVLLHISPHSCGEIKS